MFFPLAQDFRGPMQHDPSEPGPIFVVPIDHHCNRRVLAYVSQALERGAGLAFRLFVDRDAERIATYREAHRHDMGNCVSISGSKMADPSIGQELARGTRQHAHLNSSTARHAVPIAPKEQIEESSPRVER
jgi:hypothetical protein